MHILDYIHSCKTSIKSKIFHDFFSVPEENMEQNVIIQIKLFNNILFLNSPSLYSHFFLYSLFFIAGEYFIFLPLLDIFIDIMGYFFRFFYLIRVQLIIYTFAMIQNIEKINQINQDLRIRSYYLQPTQYYTNYQHSKLFNNDRLMNTLLKRNKQFTRRLPNEKQPLPQQFRQLQQKIKEQTKKEQRRSQIKQVEKVVERQIRSELNWQKFTLGNQQQFTDKHQEYIIHGLIKNSMKNSKDVEKQLKGSIKNRILGVKDQVRDRQIGVSSESIIRTMMNSFIESAENSKIYHNFIKRHVLDNQARITNIQDLTGITGQMSVIWNIISAYYSVFDNAGQNPTGNPKIGCINIAIKMIGEEFKKQMPELNKQNELNDYIRKKFLLNAKSNEYDINQEGNLQWGIPYILFRAGAWSKFIYSLNNCGKHGVALREHFCKFYQSLHKQDPSRQNFLQASITDIFYKQLVSIAKGNNFDDHLYQIGSLDLIWLLLMTQKIYEHQDETKQAELEENVRYLTQYFILNQQELRVGKGKYIKPYIQFLFLGAYQALFEYHKKCKRQNKMKMHDYIHLLLVLQSKPELMTKNCYEALVQVLEKQLRSFLVSLLNGSDEQKDYLIFYILKIPKRYFGSVIANTITDWKYFSIVNKYSIDWVKGWKHIKVIYDYNGSFQIFQDAMVTLLRNLSLTEQDQDIQKSLIECAEQLFKKPQNLIGYLLETQCRNMLKLRQSTNQKNIKLCRYLNKKLEQTLQSYQQLKSIYEPIIKFIKKSYKLSQLYDEKIKKNLEQFLKDEYYINKLSTLILPYDNQLKSIYKMLCIFGAEVLFFTYLKKVLLCNEIVMYGRGNSSQLQKYKNQIRSSLKMIQSEDVELYERIKSYLQI